MKVLIAPDKFKGTFSADAVCAIVGEMLRAYRPSYKVISLPLADGGEGTCALLTKYHDGKLHEAVVHDPLGREIVANYGISKDGSTAFIEMASASGLQLLGADEYNPLLTSTLGTGEMIRHAIDNDATSIVLGIGGSATNDGGIGAASALGVIFRDEAGHDVTPVGKNLISIAQIDTSGVDRRLKAVNMKILCDVDNPLVGEQGAAEVFSRQKGASEADVVELDMGLRHLASVLQRQFDFSVDYPGAGAAGGLSVMLKLIIPSMKIHRGFDVVSSLTDLESKIDSVDVVITGEGKFDAGSLSGKVVGGVVGLALRQRKPVIVMAGQAAMAGLQQGDFQLITIVNEKRTAQQAIQQPVESLKSCCYDDLMPLLQRIQQKEF